MVQLETCPRWLRMHIKYDHTDPVHRIHCGPGLRVVFVVTNLFFKCLLTKLLMQKEYLAIAHGPLVFLMFVIPIILFMQYPISRYKHRQIIGKLNQQK